MHKLKRIFCTLLIITLTLSLMGCTPGAIIKGTTGLDVDVGKDGNIQFENEGGKVSIGSAKWDKSKMQGLEAPKATLDSYVDGEDGTVYIFSDMKEKDAEAYVEKIKDSGFSYNTVTMSDYSFAGTDKEGFTISFLYDKDSGGGSVSCSKGEVPSEDDKNSSIVLGDSDHEWESSEVGGLPDPGEEIIAYSDADGYTTYSFEKFGNAEEYLGIIKDAGFTEEASMSDFEGTLMYQAYNSDGAQITFMASENGATITYMKSKAEDE